MIAQKLEQMIEHSTKKTHMSIDIYADGTTVLYTKPMAPIGPIQPMDAPMRPLLHRQEGPFGPSYQEQPLDYGNSVLEPLTPITQEPLQNLIIEPYKRGMELEGGMKLYGDEETAVFHQDLGDGNSFDIHHHNRGGGAIDFNPRPSEREDRFRIILPWEKK